MYGSMINKLRRERKISQTELGERLGIGVSTISVWESEKRTPSLHNLVAMSEIFGVSVDHIIFGDEGRREYTRDEIELVELYAQLSKKEQAEVRGFVKGFLMASDK